MHVSLVRRVLAIFMVASTLAVAAPALMAEPADAAGGNAGAAKVALAQVGKRYKKNATGPNAFDCSGLVAYAYARVGKSVPHSSAALSRMRKVPMSSLQVGDVVGRPGHVGIYIGNGKMVHAAAPGKGVRVDSISRMRWAVRP